MSTLYNMLNLKIIAIMKKSYLMLLVCACALSVMMSCGHSPEEISKREIVKEVNKILKNSATYFVSDVIKVGTYECNDESEREILRKLEAAGLITYDVKRIAWWEKSFKNETKTYYETEYYWGWAYQVPKSYKQKKAVYDFNDHYIVTVTLTENGQKYVINETPKPIDDDELEQPEIDLSSYDWIGKDLSENWDEIENPFIKKETLKDTTTETKTPTKEETKSSQAKSTQKSDGIERIDSKQYDKYKAFSDDIKKVKIKLFEIEACDARYIRITEKDKEKIATAFVTICTTDVTDFARVIYGMEDDQKAVVPVVLSYFMDKGWIIENRYDFAKAASINLFDDIIGKAMEEKSSNNANADTIVVDEVVVEEVADSVTIGY